MSARPGAHRIGQFARRVGVSPELLRAWEQRYGLLQPVRSAGGFRLYTEEDADRVARMRRALAEGLSAAEAARVALENEPSTHGLIEDARMRLLAAVEAYDEAALQAVLDDGLAAFGLEPFVRDLILPALAEIGRRWQAGNGISRTIRFLETMQCTILSGHRRVRPFGLAGGEPGRVGRNFVRRSDGRLEALAGCDETTIEADEAIIIETPTAGGYGQQEDRESRAGD